MTHGLASINHFGLTRKASPEQTGTTATPTPATATPGTPGPTAVTTVTPTVTATSTFPDPTPILQRMIAAYGRLSRAHFLTVTDIEQKGVERVHVSLNGDATCTGPSFKGHITASDTNEQSSQVRRVSLAVVVVKTKVYIKGKVTKSKWLHLKTAQAKVYGLPIANQQPLVCPNAAGSGSNSGGSTQIKDLQNLGPDTSHGASVWHIRATEIFSDNSTAQLDFLISQKSFLPYVFTVNAVVDPKNNVNLTQTQTLSKFGEKVSVKAPRVGT